MKIILLTSSLQLAAQSAWPQPYATHGLSAGDQVALISTFSGGGQPFYKISDAVEVIYLANVVGIKRKSLVAMHKGYLRLGG